MDSAAEMTKEEFIAALMRTCAKMDQDLELFGSAGSTPVHLESYILHIFNMHRSHPGLISDYELIETFSPWLMTFASYIGAAKDLQLFRDGRLSKHVARFNSYLIDIHDMNYEVSQAIMATWPKAYLGMTEEWTSTAKSCL